MNCKKPGGQQISVSSLHTGRAADGSSLVERDSGRRKSKFLDASPVGIARQETLKVPTEFDIKKMRSNTNVHQNQT